MYPNRHQTIALNMDPQDEYNMYGGQPMYEAPLQDAASMWEPAPSAWTHSEAPIAGQLDDENHLQMEDMYGVQTRYFDISMDASLSDCAADKNNAIWKLPPDLHAFLQQVVTNKNRSNASSSDLAGNLERVIPLKATIVEVHNEHSVPIGINIPGFVPQTFTNKGRFLWTLQPKTAPTQVEFVVSEPDNFLTKRMYNNWRKCDIDQLKSEIKFSDDDELDKYATMRTDGLAFQVLMDAIMDGKFGNSLNPHAIREAAQISRRVEIDDEIARKVYEAIETPLKDIEKRFMNMTKFQARFVRADGRPFDSPHGLVGTPVNGVSTGFSDKNARYTKKRAGIRLKLDYVLYD